MSASAGSADTPFRFLHLPQDIRVKIYNCVCSEDIRIADTTFSPSNPTTARTFRPDVEQFLQNSHERSALDHWQIAARRSSFVSSSPLALLHTSHRLRTEAYPCFFAHSRPWLNYTIHLLAFLDRLGRSAVYGSTEHITVGDDRPDGHDLALFAWLLRFRHLGLLVRDEALNENASLFKLEALLWPRLSVGKLFTTRLELAVLGSGTSIRRCEALLDGKLWDEEGVPAHEELFAMNGWFAEVVEKRDEVEVYKLGEEMRDADSALPELYYRMDWKGWFWVSAGNRLFVRGCLVQPVFERRDSPDDDDDDDDDYDDDNE